MVELLVSITVMLVVLIGIYSLINATQLSHLTENRKIAVYQRGRASNQFIADHLRSAGSVLSLLETSQMLGQTPIFNGIYPLNNINYPDGIILSSGDPHAVSETTSDFSSSETTVPMQTTLKVDSTSAWAEGDIGMIIRRSSSADGAGYYIFAVSGVSSTELTVSSQPIYYSGLLNTSNYSDSSNDGSGTYPSGSRVVRLDYFYALLAKDESDGSKSLRVVADFGGNADILNTALSYNSTEKRQIGPIPLLYNLEDLQFSYVKMDGSISSGASVLADCLAKSVASVHVQLLMQSEEERYSPGTAGGIYNKPAMGDRAATVLPEERSHYHYSEFEVYVRNYRVETSSSGG